MSKLPSPAVAKTAFGAFERGVERMMERNHIRTPPNIKITEINTLKSPASYDINPNDPVGLIEIHSKLATEGATPIAMGTVAHETGHLLAKHTVGIAPLLNNGLIDVANPFVFTNVPLITSGWRGKLAVGKSLLHNVKQYSEYAKPLTARYKAQEHEADQIMTHLLGSKEDSLKVRRAMTSGSEWMNEFSKLNETTVLSRAFSPVSQWLQRSSFKKLYGTAEELEHNIAGVDLTDRSHVNRLIAQRYVATMHVRT